MSIAALKKVSVVGPAREMPRALDGLQQLGCVHLLPLSSAPERPEDMPSRTAKASYKALYFLAEVAEPRRQVRRARDFDVAAFTEEVLELRDQIRETRDRRDFLKARIAAVRPWGDLVFPPRETLAGQRLWFYQLALKDRSALAEVALPWQIVARDTRHLFVVVIAPDEPPGDLLPVQRTHTGALPIRELEGEVEETEILLEALEAERIALTRYLTLMRASMSEAESLAEIDFARQQVFTDEDLFALQGWAPEDRIDDIDALASKEGYAVLVEPPARSEAPPTLLDQPEERSAGVDLAMFYQVPGYRDWDPTVILSASFAIFFAMIVADAGYGLLIAVGIGAFWRRFGGTVDGRSWRRLLAIIAGATILYGLLVGSFFGYAPPDESLLGAFRIMSVDDFETMMRLSIVIGVVHLMLANVLAARARWGRPQALASLGWCAVLAGGLVFWLARGEQLATIGVIAMVAGFVAILLFSSGRPIRKSTDWLWRGLGGLQGLAGAMGMFGDVLSYMRLFALGLASASLAITFNGLAADVRSAVPGLGVLLGLLIFLIGHTLNFGLAVMSGVVHGLRLNYMEFFKWGLSEEGTAFRPLARKEIDA